MTDTVAAPASPQKTFAAVTDRQRRSALILLFVVSLFNYGDRNMIGVLIPSIKADLQLSDTELGFISGIAFALFYAVMGIPIARLADTMSRRTVVATAVAVWSAMTAACGLAQNFVQLAVARVLVGVGEAGATPPSHAIISDLYPKARRAGAIAIYSFGSPAGVILAYSVGAWITEHWGWRATLFAFGLPGLLFALVLWRLLPDPPRGHSDGDTVTAARLGETFKHLMARPAFVHNAVASGVFAFLWFGLLSWAPSFFTRTHGMPIGEVGAWLALALGVAQLLGTWLGGYFGDKLGPRDVRWYPWICVIVMVASTPFYLIVFLWPDPLTAIVVLSIPVCLSVMQGAPQHWITQAVAGPRMRATATALYLMIVNVISGFGAQIVGVLSDRFAPDYGIKSLGYALLIVCVVFSVWAALHFWLIARTLERDIAQN